MRDPRPTAPRVRRARAPLAIVAAVLLLGAAGGCLPIASGAPEGIFRVRPEGGEPARVADHPARPVWSPDGDRIAFSAPDGLWTASPDGEDVRRIVAGRNLAAPAWAPDGRVLAVVDNDARQLRLVDQQGAAEGEFPLAESDPGGASPIYIQDNTPSWSPDGTRIAFTAWDGSGDEIFRIDRGGGERTRLTNLRASDEPADGENPAGPKKAYSDAGRPDWSPNGDLIAYALFPELREAPGGVYMVEADTGRASRLAKMTPSFGPVWSPDGRALLFVHRGEEGPNLYLLDVATKAVVNLTIQSDLVPRDGAWSPSGDRIAFSATDGALYVMTVADRAIAPLADTPLDDIGPAWSPDGEWIAFRAQRDLFDQPSLPPLP